jgi:hypothetical protein
MDITQADLVNWRALVRRTARNYEAVFDAMSDDEAARCDYPDDAEEFRRLGDWLDSLAGASMGKPVNGHGRVLG